MRLEQRLQIGFALVGLVLLTVAVGSYRNVRKASLADAWVLHTQTVQTELAHLASSLKDAETGERGFLLTGELRYLEPYFDAKRNVEAHFDALRTLTADNPRQQERLLTFRPRVDALLQHFEDAIAKRRQLPAVDPRLNEGMDQGKALMDALRQLVATMADEESRLMKARAAESEAQRNRSLMIDAAGISLLLALFGFNYLRVRREIAERAQLQDQLAKARDEALAATRDKSSFLANMSHEIRTPMNGVIGMMEALLDTPLTPRQKEIADTVRFSANALMTVINDVLDFSKIEAGMLHIETTGLNVATTVEQVIELFAERVRAKGIELVAAIHPSLQSDLRGDPVRLHQALANLISNAIKFTERGEIVVEAKEEHQTPTSRLVRFAVRDTGPGLSEEARSRLFRPYTQADVTTARMHGGTGLGLTIVRQLSAAMGGSCGVDSEPGKGSTFWFTALLERPSDGRASPSLAGFGGQRMLVVDDSEACRRALLQQTRAWGFATDACASFAEARAQVSSAVESGKPYQVIVIDQQMPDGDGLQLAKDVRRLQAHRGARVVLLQSQRGVNAPEAVRAAGVTSLLTKPVRYSDLYNSLLDAGTDVAGERETVMPARLAEWEWKPDAPMKILVAEDNPVNQKVTEHQLRKLGLSATFVDDGLQAVEALGNHRFDVVLMDCQMPVLDGYAATAEIRKREDPHRRTWIIAVTANALAGERAKCIVAGMDDYVTKPLMANTLRAVLMRYDEARRRSPQECVPERMQ